jgi:hypothetical protein
MFEKEIEKEKKISNPVLINWFILG